MGPGPISKNALEIQQRNLDACSKNVSTYEQSAIESVSQNYIRRLIEAIQINF